MLDKRIIDLLKEVHPGESLSPERALTIVASAYPSLEWAEIFSLSSWLWFCRS